MKSKLLIKKRDLFLYVELIIIFSIIKNSGSGKYLIFLLWVIYHLFNKKLSINKNSSYILMPIYFCVGIGLFTSFLTNVTFNTFKEVVFIALSPIGALVLWDSIPKEKTNYYINIMFKAITVVFLIGGIRRFDLNNLMESSYAFVYGVFVIYYFYQKEKKMLLLSVLMLVLANKRIALGAALISVIVVIIIDKKKSTRAPNFKKMIRIVRCLGIITTIGAVFYVYLCKTNIISNIMTQFNLNSMGRLAAWLKLNSFYEVSIKQIGYGLGSVAGLLREVELSEIHFERLHNDILVYYIELGFLGFVIYIYSYFEMIVVFIKKKIINYKKIVILCSFIIYHLICFCTDNISIYINYLFPMYFVMCNVVFGVDPEK